MSWLSTAACVIDPFGPAEEDGADTGGDGGNACGPTTAIVETVLDGDTVELDSGERVRYLLVDTPELSGPECWAEEARIFNRDLVTGKEVNLEYDAECRDNFGRLLAYVSLAADDREVNSLLVERGYACVLHIPPNGSDRVAEFNSLQNAAEIENRGMWGNCANPCD